MALEDFSFGDIFRGTADYADTLGPEEFATAFPNFNQLAYGEDGVLRYGIIRVKAGPGVEWMDVPGSELGIADDDEDVGRLFRKAHDFAQRSHRFGLPNFHRYDYGRGMVHGIILLDRSVVTWEDVPRPELGAFDDADVGERFRRSHALVDNDDRYASAFPNFHNKENAEGVMCYGTVLVKSDAASFEDVRDEVMRVFWRFEYSLAEREDRKSLRLAQRTAIKQVAECGGNDALSSASLRDLQAVFERVVNHVAIDEADDTLLRCDSDGSEIRVNLAKWNEVNKPTRKAAIAHMMMHLAGKSHPNQPGPGYAGSDPVKAERCTGPRKPIFCTGNGGSWRMVSGA